MTRQDFLDQVHAHLAKGRHVLLTGGRGMGKSHLLGTVAQAHADAVFIRSLGAKKQTLLTVLRHSFDAGHLDDFAYFVDWRDVQKKLRRQTVAELQSLATTALAAHPYLVVLDNLDLATERTMLDIVLPLMEAAQFLAAADTSTPTKAQRVGLAVDKFKALEVPPLTAAETRALLWAVLN